MPDADPPIELDVRVRTDPAANKLVGEATIKQTRAGMGPGLNLISKDIKDAFKAKGAVNPILAELGKMEKAARSAVAPIDSLEQKLADVVKRSKAFKDTLDSRGIDKNLFVSYDNALKDAIRFQEEFNRRREEIARNPALRKAFERQAKDINQVLRTETQNASKFLQAEHGRQIVEQQRALTLQNTANRLAGQKLIQDERQRSRARVEIFRFTTRQILFFERQIANALRGAVGIVGKGVGAIGGAISSLGQVFHRSNAHLNDGLRGALLQREGALSRSFGRQTREVRSEVTKQSAIITRFQAQSSTGVVGALSGRSTVGTALGLGAGIGGGFALFQGLKNGLKVGGDFVQGLAVLQAQLKLTDEQMAAVRQQSIDLGNDISLPGVSALDAAQAIQILAKQFANLGDAALPAAQAGARGVLQLARASGVQADEAARVVGAAVNVFAVSADKAVDVADQITNALTKAAGVGFGDFADAFTQSAGVVNLFTGAGHDATDTLAEFNAAIAVLAKSGLIGSDAGTSLKQFFLQANRGTKQATEILDQVVKQAGVTGSVFFDASGSARTLGESLDILRRGLSGLSNQDFSSALQKLFGSDAARAAAFLVQTTTQQFTALTAEIKEQGSAAAIAAAQNTGLRGALDALKSVIETQQIKTYEKFQKVLGRVVLRFADLLNKFFEGVGIFGVIRAGLAGLAIALGALLVAKTAAESFGLLRTSLAVLANPLGFAVVGIAAIGAAIGVLSKISPKFRTELAKIGDALRDKLNSGLGAVADKLAQFAQFMRTEVVPRLVEFGIAVARRVLPAISAFADLIVRIAVPAINTLREVWGLLIHGDFTGVGPWEEDSPVVDALLKFRETVADVVAFVADSFSRGLSATVRGVRGFAGEVVDAVQPVIDGFDRVRQAVEDAFRVRSVKGGGRERDIASLLPTISPARIVAGLGLGALGALIGGPLGAAIGAAIGVAVGGANLLGLADRLIDAVRPQLERLVAFIGDFLSGANVQGFLLGPFQDAVATLGQFLGKLATNPRLLDALVKIAGLGVLTGVSFLKGLLKGIVQGAPGFLNKAADIIDDAFNGALKKALSHPFQFFKLFALAFGGFQLFKLFAASGAQAGQGFLSGFGSKIATGAQSQRQFLSGFLGGEGGIDAQARAVAERTQKALRTEFDRANRDLVRLGQTAQRPTLQGPTPGGGFLLSEQDLVVQKKRMDDLKVKLGQTFGAGALAQAQFKEGFRGLGDFFGDFANQMGGKGRAIGVTLGTGILSGVGAALAGQQLGGASSIGGAGIGLAGIIGAALIPALTIPGPVGLGLAGVTVAIGAIAALTSAFKDNGDAAEVTKGKIEGYVGILQQFSTTAGAIPALADHVTDVLLTQGGGVNQFLADSGFNVRGFVAEVTQGQGSLGTAVRDLTGGLNVDQRRIQDFIDSEIRLGDTGQEALDKLSKAARGKTTDTQATALIAEIKAGGGDAQAFVDILQTLFDEAGLVLTGVSQNGLRQQLLATTQAASGLSDVFLNNLGKPIDALKRSTSTRGQTVFFDNLRSNADLAAKRVEDVDQAIDLLNTKRTDALNSQIQAVTTKLDGAREAASAAVEAVLELVTGDLFSGAQQAFDQLILQVPSIAEALAQAQREGLSLTELGDETFNGARLRNILQPFSQAIQATVAQGIKDGADTPEEIAVLFEQAKAQIGTFTIPTEFTAEDGTVTIQQIPLAPEVKDFLLGQIQGFLDDPNLALGLQQIVITEQAAQDLQAELDRLGALLKVNVQFSEAQVRRALEELGLLATGALPGFENGFQKTELSPTSLESSAERNRAILEAQRQAVLIARLPTGTQTASNAIPNTTFNVTQNIYETSSAIRTGGEAASALRAAARDGRIPHVGANA